MSKDSRKIERENGNLVEVFRHPRFRWFSLSGLRGEVSDINLLRSCLYPIKLSGVFYFLNKQLCAGPILKIN